MLEIERRVKALLHSIALGSVEGAEILRKARLQGSLLIQSEDHSIDQLLSLNDKYEVIYTNVYEGTVNQVCLRLSSPDRELQRLYEKTFPSCTTQMVFGKSF